MTYFVRVTNETSPADRQAGEVKPNSRREAARSLLKLEQPAHDHE
jgi:hypothetical protein